MVQAQAVHSVEPMFSPFLAAGRAVLSSRLVEATLCALLRMPRLPELLEALLLGDELGGCLLQWPLPSGAHGATYGELVRAVARRGAVPLGLLRAGAGGEACSSPLPYVLANPPGDLRLHAADRLFVLAPPAAEPTPGDRLLVDTIGQIQ